MLTPSEYALKYHHLWTVGFHPDGGGLQGSGPFLTPVFQYLNRRYTNKAGKSPGERLAYKDHLLGFFKQRANKGDGITFSKGDGYTLECSSYPVRDFERSNFMAAFCGKGSPTMLWGMIQLISYWRAWKVHREGLSVASVAEIVDKYLGADCNGFVGNYLRDKYAGVKVGPSTKERDFRNGARKRTSPSELRADDVLVFDGFGHVAIIDRVLSFDSSGASCIVAESRSKAYGGPQFQWYRIEGSGGSFAMRGQKLDSIVRVKGT